MRHWFTFGEYVRKIMSLASAAKLVLVSAQASAQASAQESAQA
jgi:hypothetical protein